MEDFSHAKITGYKPVNLSRKNSGTTFIELMVALAIIAILIGMAMPGFSHLVGKTKSDNVQSTLRMAIHRTRSAAITHKKIIVLCPLGATACGDNWASGAMIFTDSNNNHIIDDEDTVLEQIDFQKGSVDIHWRASAGRNFLRYSPTGMAREFGRFTICNKKQDLTLARSIVINRQGRLRQYRDRDGDGIVEDTDGRLPECP